MNISAIQTRLRRIADRVGVESISIVLCDYRSPCVWVHMSDEAKSATFGNRPSDKPSFKAALLNCLEQLGVEATT